MANKEFVYVLLETGRISPVGIFANIESAIKSLPEGSTEIPKTVLRQATRPVHRTIVGEWVYKKTNSRFRLVSYDVL